MLYMFLINYDPSVSPRPDEPRSLQPEHQKLELELREKGVYVSGAGLMPVEVAVPVRVKGGRRLATDGAFAETKEVLGGYFIIECNDAAEATVYAGRIPVDSRSWVEVRQILLFHPNAKKIAGMTA